MLSQHTEDNIMINQESCVVISPGSAYNQEVRHIVAYNMFHTTHRRMFILEDETQAVENKEEVRRDTMPTIVLFNL
jgi:hypothetical protein